MWIRVNLGIACGVEFEVLQYVRVLLWVVVVGMDLPHETNAEPGYPAVKYRLEPLWFSFPLPISPSNP